MRFAVGWAMSERITRDLTVGALWMTLILGVGVISALSAIQLNLAIILVTGAVVPACHPELLLCPPAWTDDVGTRGASLTSKW
jgi:hypothetical protein